VGAIILTDLLLLPWILKFPSFLISGGAKGMATAPSWWLDYGIFKSIKDVWLDAKFRKVYFVMQLPVAALILGVSWDVTKFKKKNRIADGVGGPEPAGSGQHGTSRWQNKQEMDRTAFVWDTDTPIKKAGVVFGMEKSRNGKEKVWLNNDDVHALLIAATRAGKSRKILLPTIWSLAQAGESMILGDVKGELYDAAGDYLKSLDYNVITLNLREPAKGNQWNMLDLVNRAVLAGDVARATELAWDIAHTISNQTPSPSGEPIWRNGEESTIAALILLTALNSEFEFQKHMTTVFYLLAEQGQALEDGTVPLMEYIKSLPTTHPAKGAFATASIAPYKTRASFFTTALSDTRLFSDPNIADMTAKQDHDMRQIGIQKTAVFLIIPDEKSTRDVLATLYIDQVYQSMVDLANDRGGRIPRRVNFLLDEFGNLPAIPDFPKKLTVAGGRGMKFLLAIQALTQLDELYKKNASTIKGNCHIWIYFATMDHETAKLLSEMTGKYTVETENASSSVQPKSHSISHGVGLAARPLLLPDEIERWSENESLVLFMRNFPARYPIPDLSYWRANKDFGYVSTGDIDHDKEVNRQINEKRRQEYPVRQLKELEIWIPGFDYEEGEEIEVRVPVEPQPKETVYVENQARKEVAIALSEEGNSALINTTDDEMQSTTSNLNDLLKMEQDMSNDGEDDENFL
jgi:type IV secretion system protein VirD4